MCLLLVTGESGEHIVHLLLLLEFFLNLEVPSQGIYVACYIISSTLRVGFLVSFSSVSKYLTDWDICNEAYSVIADEGDISFQLQVFDLTDEVFRLFYQWACVS
jgi:hypothetical protein